jgi:cytochrome c553
MRYSVLGLALGLSLALAGCTDEKKPPAQQAAADIPAGKAFAEKECKGCHGLDGKGTAPAIPHLAAQSERYLFASLTAYREGKRTHAALKDMTKQMSDADLRNVSAFYAGLPPVAVTPVGDAQQGLPYEKGKALAAPCAKCHGEDGNSQAPGTPSLAGQQPRYFVTALQEYLAGERKKSPMHPMLPGFSKLDMENLALYFASQSPAKRTAPSVGDPAAGEPLTAVCGGCHGAHGVSSDTATPSLAGQDAQYLLEAIKAYRTTRKRESMRAYVAGLKDTEIENIAAFYSVQEAKASERGQTIIKDLTEKCARCHAPGVDNPALAIPKINGQDRDYLVMALRAYRDDRRESTTMHKMSLPYGDSVIESVATYYASQPPK